MDGNSNDEEALDSEGTLETGGHISAERLSGSLKHGMKYSIIGTLAKSHLTARTRTDRLSLYSFII
jgi:hypothetical protein